MFRELSETDKNLEILRSDGRSVMVIPCGEGKGVSSVAFEDRVIDVEGNKPEVRRGVPSDVDIRNLEKPTYFVPGIGTVMMPRLYVPLPLDLHRSDCLFVTLEDGEVHRFDP